MTLTRVRLVVEADVSDTAIPLQEAIGSCYQDLRRLARRMMSLEFRKHSLALAAPTGYGQNTNPGLSL